MPESGWRVDEHTQQLIVPGGREAERSTHGLLLLPGMLPPPILEFEDREVTLPEWFRVRVCRFSWVVVQHSPPLGSPDSWTFPVPQS